MGGDLDTCSVEEVARRAVRPAVEQAALVVGRPISTSVRLCPPPGYSATYRDDAAEIWAVFQSLPASDLATRVCKCTFERWDAREVAHSLLDELLTWLGGKDFTITPADVVVPEPPRPSLIAGLPVLEFYPDEGVSLPLWHRGEQLRPEALSLSSSLLEALQSWQRDWQDYTESESRAWRTIVRQLEPRRQALTEELARALHGRYAVLPPLPIPLCP